MYSESMSPSRLWSLIASGTAIRKSGGYSNWEMIVLKEFRGHCEKDRAILNQRKRAYKKQYMASLNGYTIAKTKEIKKKSV